MSTRNRIKTNWGKILYLPLAILQWFLFTIILSGAGIFIVTPIGIIVGITHLILLNKEEAIISFELALMPITIPLEWWYDYITKGEIGLYD